MKYQFETPEQITIEFRPYSDGNSRRPFKIPLCTQVKTGKEVVIVYLARDGKEHRHKYPCKIIDRVYSSRQTYFVKRRFVVNMIK